MTLKNILESVNLATERKKKFEAEKTRSSYWDYYAVLTDKK